MKDEQEVGWVKHEVKNFIKISKAAVEAIVKAKQQTPDREQWVGIIPFLRLIHCITDCDDAKEAYLNSFSTLSHSELDGRHNQDTPRLDPWVLVSNNWNDSEFNPVSRMYPDLHNEFISPIELSYTSIAGMDTLYSRQSKIQVFKMKK